MDNKRKKRCSTWLVIREMQIKTTVRYHFIPLRMTKFKMTDNTKHWWGCVEAPGTFRYSTLENSLAVSYQVENIRDFPGGPVVKNPSCNAGDTGSIPGRGTKIPHAAGQLSPCATTWEPKCHNYRAHVLWSPRATAKSPRGAMKDPACRD